MEANRQEQIEALETLLEFNGRILQNIPILVKELSGARLEDTAEFQTGIINAINWEVQVINGTMEVLNEGKERVSKDAVNEKIQALADALKEKEDAKLAKAFEALIPVLEDIGKAAAEVIA